MKIELKEIECKQGAKNLAKILARNTSGNAKEDPGFKKDLVKIFTKNIQSVEGIVCDEKTLKAYEKKGYSEKVARLLVFLTNLYPEIAAHVEGFKNAKDVEEFFTKKNAKKDIKSSIIYEIAKAFKIEDEVQEILEQDDLISVEKAGKLAKVKVERRYRLTNDEKIKIEEARVRMLERELDEGLGDILKLAANGIKKGLKKGLKKAKEHAFPIAVKASKAAKDKVNSTEYQLEDKIEKNFGKSLPEFMFNSKSKSFWNLKNLIKNVSKKNEDLAKCLNYIKKYFTKDGKEINNIESLFETPKLLITFNNKKAMKRFIDKNTLETEVYDLTKSKNKISEDKLKKSFLRDMSYNEMDSHTSFSEGGYANYIVAFNEEDANSLAGTWRDIIEGKFKKLEDEEKADALDDVGLKNVHFHLLPPNIEELDAKKFDYKTGGNGEKGEELEDDEDEDEDSKEKKESFIVYKKRIR